jgi:hypothetical protein
MRKNYIIPATEIIDVASMPLMQAQAVSTQSMGLQDIPSDQW